MIYSELDKEGELWKLRDEDVFWVLGTELAGDIMMRTSVARLCRGLMSIVDHDWVFSIKVGVDNQLCCDEL